MSNPTDCAAVPCSVESAIGLVGGKWKLYVLRVLLVSGPQRYNGLLAAVEGISPKVLTQNLRELEQAGVVRRTGEDRAVSYALTASGARLFPALHALGEWFDQHDRSSDPSPSGSREERHRAIAG